MINYNEGSVDYNRGFVHGYEKAYEEIMAMARKSITKYDPPKGSPEFDDRASYLGAVGAVGPVGYDPNYNMRGAKGL